MKYYTLWNDQIQERQIRCFQTTSKCKNYFKKEKYGAESFKELSKFQEFQLSNFTLTWSNKGKMNSLQFDMTYLKELQQKIEMLDKLILKNI